jgi:ABC-type Fe3+ transport system permease subunit
MLYLIKKIKYFLDWNYLIAYNENVIKGDNSLIGASLFVSVDFMTFFTIIYVLVNNFLQFEIKAVIAPILFAILVFANYFYYEILKNRIKITYKQKPNDYLKKISFTLMLLFVFFLTMYFLHFVD